MHPFDQASTIKAFINDKIKQKLNTSIEVFCITDIIKKGSPIFPTPRPYFSNLHLFFQPPALFFQPPNLFFQPPNLFFQHLNLFIQPLNLFFQPLNIFLPTQAEPMPAKRS